MNRLIDFSKHTSLKIGVELPVGIISQILECPVGHVIGGGNNLLISPEAKNLWMLGKEFDYIQDLGEQIEVGGAVSSGRIFSYFKNYNLWGLEFLRGLPGRLGGLVKMNAGMKQYEMIEVLESVCVDGVWKTKTELGFGYRKSGITGVIYAARFRKLSGFRSELLPLFESLRDSHPHLPSCGSCFKNPAGDFAGRLLESAGLKGKRVGGVAFSEKHANFLVNLGGGTFSQAKELIIKAKERVWQEHGVRLETEVVIIE